MPASFCWTDDQQVVEHPRPRVIVSGLCCRYPAKDVGLTLHELQQQVDPLAFPPRRSERVQPSQDLFRGIGLFRLWENQDRGSADRLHLGGVPLPQPRLLPSGTIRAGDRGTRQATPAHGVAAQSCEREVGRRRFAN